MVWREFLIAHMIISVLVAERDSFQQSSQKDSAKGRELFYMWCRFMFYMEGKKQKGNNMFRF